MRSLRLHKKILLHGLAWIILLTVNFLFLHNYSVRFDLVIQIINWISYILIFYTTLYLLMPLLFKKKALYFFSLSLLLIIGIYLIRDLSIRTHFNHTIATQEVMFPPKPDFNREPPPLPPVLMQKELKNTMPFFDRRRILMSSYSLVLFYLLAVSFRFIMKWQEDEFRRSELEKENIRTELSFLKQQINPHFLFNSLNTIYSLSLGKSDKSTDAILKLSSILRYVIYESENTSVTLQKEIDTIRDYIEMNKLRLTDKTRLNFQCTGDPADNRIEPLLLLPIIENAFKYGTDTVHDSFIDITLNMDVQSLELKASNKIAADVRKNQTENGIGIKNIKRRLEIQYPDNYQLDITNEKGIFTLFLRLKLKK